MVASTTCWLQLSMDQHGRQSTESLLFRRWPFTNISASMTYLYIPAVLTLVFVIFSLESGKHFLGGAAYGMR
jgi:hypothetical protein